MIINHICWRIIGKVKEFHHIHAPEPGVFMEEIIKELKKRNVNFEMEDAGK